MSFLGNTEMKYFIFEQHFKFAYWIIMGEIESECIGFTIIKCFIDGRHQDIHIQNVFLLGN
jgi:hypothetical protein